MKIYISNIFPSTIKNKLTNLKDLQTNSFDKFELASEDYGIHYIEKSKGNNANQNNEKIYRCEPNFEPKFQLIKNFGPTNSDLFIDKTKYVYCPVVSQLPVNYVLTKLTILEYQTSKKAHLKLVIECLKEPVVVGSYFSPDKHMGEELVPINFYFVYDELTNLDLSDQFFQEEFNMFLSHLN
jgi:hypothetical protein